MRYIALQLMPAIVRAEWSALCSGHFIPEKTAPVIQPHWMGWQTGRTPICAGVRVHSFSPLTADSSCNDYEIYCLSEQH